MQYRFLHTINTPEDLRQLPVEALPELAQELRDFIINIVATKEGHLGASLGVVELTIALHYSFNTPKDLLIWDVGHQAYGHKILTGRRETFHTNREWGGLSGFPKRSESAYDTFGVGHASTSISAALGMALASKLNGDLDKQHIAVIGDASIAAGMAFEGLNHAGVTDANLLVILNDNAIGIDPSVGALKNYLTNVKKGTQKRNNIIEALNFNYSGPIDGHDLPKLLKTLERLKKRKGPKLLHIITTKGKGLKQAETDQVTYHAPGKFNAETGELYQTHASEGPIKYQDVFGLSLVELAKENKNIVGITAAMPTGTSLKYLMKTFPERTFDVGIAEQHAVTMAAGMATQGLVPFCAIYSTFLQRSYDQIIHDVALQKLPVIFCLDRAGLVGKDGATHHGVFDLSYLRCIPNMIIAAPRNEVELRNIMYTAQQGLSGPIAIRYPRDKGVITAWKQPFKMLKIGRGEVIKPGTDVAVLSIGTMAKNVTEALHDLPAAHYDLRYVKPLDAELLHAVFENFKSIITVEDNSVKGGFGAAILEFAAEHDYRNKITVLGIPDTFIDHGDMDQLQKFVGLDAASIKAAVLRELR